MQPIQRFITAQKAIIKASLDKSIEPKMMRLQE